ncbi:MAG: glycine/betaine ABC transporter substrate-binding protein [Actinomycetota bacterium]|nr:glycine/betaine ABC transporter substrate-binding protein [Actinomycetota bacterium]
MKSSLRFLLAALAALMLALGATACGSDDESDSGGDGGGSASSEPGGGKLIEKDPANAGKSITVGSKNFDEQFVLGEIYSQALEAAGFKVEKKLNLGSEQIAYKALKSGQVDAYPEYTGTSLTSFFDVKIDDVPKDPDEAYELTKEEYAKQDITALPRTQFENTYRIVTTTEKQKDLLEGATTLSEVADMPNAGELSIAGFPECRQRTDCLLGLKNVYSWTPEFVSDEGKYEPINKDRSDLGFVFSTDGELTTGKYAIIEDDKSLFPPYNISFGIRNDALEKIGPKGEEVLLAVQEPLTEEVMQELNSRASIDKEEPSAVAEAYLKESGFIE